MDFKELYEKYNWGQVTKEEQEFVESELKRRKEAKENTMKAMNQRIKILLKMMLLQ